MQRNAEIKYNNPIRFRCTYDFPSTAASAAVVTLVY